MSWTWSIRSRDGGMNGLEFARATTERGCRRVLVHAAPAQASVEVRDDDNDELVARSEVDAEGAPTPMTLLDLDAKHIRRREIWPGAEEDGLPVILAGGEVGILRRWENAEDKKWWRWSVEFSNQVA